eukprot:TRINITY_DN5993_c0_g1_i10.p1 TRINITY_DN5993_c0_g1~~TRINITY_DN5993_c0_g1_i10.p1  ORF type:complete len:316 (-),score=52.64 TRINITY_DN5993_c0_g1_i10:965-1912(-)
MKVEILLNSLLFLTSLADTEKDKKKHVKLPACGACTNLVASFDKGMERTKRGKFEGGDAAWEEKTQPRYATSEVRFIEITEDLCKDVERGETQCHQHHNEWEEHLETWWKMDIETRPDLRQHLCVDTLKVCCPLDHYGAECKPCSVTGLNGKVCSGNGKCKGSGTRKGNGQCHCDKEYSGPACDSCSIGHYSSYKDETTQICSACHKACADHCTGPGPKACAKCADGYQMNSEHGCMDIDECQVSQPCTKDKFCVNTEGTFRCLKCDKACDGCDADGPDNCLKCADGYTDKKGVCVAEKDPNSEEDSEEGKKEEL